MESLLRKYTHNASLVLLVTQLFSTISYAVLYSTLVLFMTMKLHIKDTNANALMGLFIAFNYGLHLVGANIGGRFLSYRNLFIIGMVLQIGACILLALQSITSLYWGLALFLAGSGLNVPCINMMLTQQFSPESTDRETAFFWNYAGMNVGFFLGFAVAGYFQLQLNFYTLFLLSASTNLIAFFLLIFGWQAVEDHRTPLVMASRQKPSIIKSRAIWGVLSIIVMIFALSYLLTQTTATNFIILIITAILFVVFFILALKQKHEQSKKKIFAYIILSVGGLVFWSLYQLAPMGLTLFAQYNVDRNVLGFTIPPQWIGNINTIIIALGGVILPPVFKKIRRRFTFGLPLQFAFSLTFIALGFLILPLGIDLDKGSGLMNISWITWSYVLQSLGELLIGPIGYSMIGLLATDHLQGLMMGSWMLLTGGVSGVIASYLSNFAIHQTASSDPIITNPGYSHMFFAIGMGAVIMAMILFALVPYLRRLIGVRFSQ